MDEPFEMNGIRPTTSALKKIKRLIDFIKEELSLPNATKENITTLLIKVGEEANTIHRKFQNLYSCYRNIAFLLTKEKD